MEQDVQTAMKGLSFGCDPELFVIDGNGEFVCADGLIPGTKAEPFKVERGAVQVDGMAAEFNTDPATTFEDFSDSIDAVMAQLKGMLPVGYDLVALPSVTFSKEVWDSSPDRAKELGCTPDFDAWAGRVNPPPNPSKNPRMRTASGHLHIGWTEDAQMDDIQYLEACRDLVKQLDWYLGAWSVYKDPDMNRRSLYGKAGAMRFKPYGVEYRVLSNFWLKDKDVRLETWNRMQTAINMMKSPAGFMPDNAKVRSFGFNNILIESINTSYKSKTLEDAFKFPILEVK